MSEQFDASRVCDEPISADLMAKQNEMVEHLMLRPSALGNARLHAENELQRLINVCNRRAWGTVPPELRSPDKEETSALLEGLAQEDRHQLMHDARLATEQRALVERMANAEDQLRAQMQAEQEALALQEEEARERADFEAQDEAEKEARFQAWRAARRGAA